MENEKNKQQHQHQQQQGHQSLSSFPYCCISHAFHQATTLNPNKTAIIQPTTIRTKHHHHHHTNNNTVNNNGDKSYTFSQLSSAINTLTLRLQTILKGATDDEPNSGSNISHKRFDLFGSNVSTVGVYMVPCIEYVVTVMSVLRLGCVFLPLDPSWPKERIFTVISSSGVSLVVGCLNESHWLVNCGEYNVFCVNFDGFFEVECKEVDLAWPCERDSVRLFSYLMYTSGSTGKPKGVCGTEGGILNRFLWMQEVYPFDGNEVVLFKTSVSFVDHLQEFLAPLLAGCTLVIPSWNELKENLFGFVDLIDEYCVTRVTAVPSLIRVVLPALEDRYFGRGDCSLKLLVLSGEVFSVSLWETVSRMLPKTCVLNIYGSTEVSGDCTYFDCRQLPGILEHEALSSVPIGVSISNCDVKLVEVDGKFDEGEICVAGACLSTGYFSEGIVMPLDCVHLTEESVSGDGHLSDKSYYRTGDYARRLSTNDLVFLGRKDRTIKVNGQRIALEEVENTLRGHPDIDDAAVVFFQEQEEHPFLGAVLVLKNNSQSSEVSRSLKKWLLDRLPAAMIPKEIVCKEAIPKSSTGKVDYTLLSSSFNPVNGSQEGHVEHTKPLDLEFIREAFGNALDASEVGNDDDFFVLGGDSILAAHVAHKFGIDMRLLYMFPTPSKLYKALADKELAKFDHEMKWEGLQKPHIGKSHPAFDSASSEFSRSRNHGNQWTNNGELGSSKRLKTDATASDTKVVTLDLIPWESLCVPSDCTLSRCNKVMYKGNSDPNNTWPETQEVELQRNTKGFLQHLWKVPMVSCVDASPLVALKGKEALIYIGSHSHKFICVDAQNGFVRWETKLEGRIECTAVIDGDFSQIVVGCYQGKIYFIDLLKGNINWTFQAKGEVKSQPTVDRCRHLIWCGSHDHYLYGLDYRNYCCVHQFPCGGSVFGSPVIDEELEVLYVGTTNGSLRAVTLKNGKFSTLWLLDLEAPVFGSLSITPKGNIICALVNGEVLSVESTGSIVWRVKTNGPIFAGPCLSKALGNQALICSRTGRVYSFDLEKGSILWEYDARDPITSSAYVDESIKLSCDPSMPSERLVSICTSSGKLILLQVCSVVAEDFTKLKVMVKVFAELDLQGDIFSSPVMVGGRVFVGSRDDNLHCVVTKAYLEND